MGEPFLSTLGAPRLGPESGGPTDSVKVTS